MLQLVIDQQTYTRAWILCIFTDFQTICLCGVAQQEIQNAEKQIDKLRELDCEHSNTYKRRWLLPSITEHTKLFDKMKFAILAATILACAIGKPIQMPNNSIIPICSSLIFTVSFSLCYPFMAQKKMTATPSTRLVLPRLPLKVFLSGKFQMIPEDKIVGGAEVAPNSLPFQISLQRRGLLANSAVMILLMLFVLLNWILHVYIYEFSKYSHICGGSLLDATTILDAAHCVDG